VRAGFAAKAAATLTGAVAAPVWAAASGIPFRPEAAEGPSSGQWGWAVAVCAAVLAVLILLARSGMLRRFIGAPLRTESTVNGLRVLESVRLTPQVRLVTVEFGPQVLLLAVAQQSVTVVGTKEAPTT